MKRRFFIAALIVSFSFFNVAYAEAIEVVIKTLIGDSYTIEIDHEATVAALKQKVQEQSGIPTGQQRFIFAASQLEDGIALAEYGIIDGSEIYLVLRLRGD